MRIDDLRIDWDEHFQRLQPYLRNGGVVCITGAKPSAWRNFIKLLREALGDEADGLAVHFDKENELTYSAEDMIAQLMRSLRLEPLHAHGTKAPDVQILSNIDADGDVTIGDVNVPDRIQLQASHIIPGPQTLDPIVEAISDRLSAGKRTALIVSNCNSFQHSRWLWHEFWPSALQDLVARGLLVVRACENDAAACPAPFSPPSR